MVAASKLAGIQPERRERRKSIRKGSRRVDAAWSEAHRHQLLPEKWGEGR